MFKLFEIFRKSAPGYEINSIKDQQLRGALDSIDRNDIEELKSVLENAELYDVRNNQILRAAISKDNPEIFEYVLAKCAEDDINYHVTSYDLWPSASTTIYVQPLLSYAIEYGSRSLAMLIAMHPSTDVTALGKTIAYHDEPIGKKESLHKPVLDLAKERNWHDVAAVIGHKLVAHYQQETSKHNKIALALAA